MENNNIGDAQKVLRRYFDGIYSLNDYKFLQQKLGSRVLDADIENLIAEHWDEFMLKEKSKDDVGHLLFRINHEIRMKENQKKKRFHLFQRFQRAAAILILPVLISFFAYVYLHPYLPESRSASFAEIQCPLGTKIKFKLPDGSIGYLNSGSKLRYPVDFSARNVELTGEGYFDVVHNERSPFYVCTESLDIKVLGTIFNITAYEDESKEEVVLKSGRVDVFSKGGEKLETLAPDQKLVLDTRSNKFGVAQVDAVQYTLWKDGMLVFRNESMKDVVKRLGRWYNAEIVIADPKLEDYRYHATFVDEPLDRVMQLISLSAPVIFHEERSLKSPGNVFDQRNITLKLDKERMNEFQ